MLVTPETRKIPIELFRNLSYRILNPKKKLKKWYSFRDRNRFRLKVFLGHITKNSLRNWYKLCWTPGVNTTKSWKILTILEGRIDVLLWRLFIVTKLRHATTIVKNFNILINGKIVFHRTEWLNPTYDELELGDYMRSKLFLFHMILTHRIAVGLQPIFLEHTVPMYLEVNWLFLCIRFNKVPTTLKQVYYPYTLDVVKGGLEFYKR